MLTQINVTVLDFDAFATADFARMNKNNTVEEYIDNLRGGPYYDGEKPYLTEKIKITKVVTLSDDDYSTFSETLLTDREWLAGEGGCGSTAYPNEDYSDLTEKQQQEWQNESYLLCVAVQCSGRPTIYVDPQGYDYARYIGLNVKDWFFKS